MPAGGLEYRYLDWAARVLRHSGGRRILVLPREPARRRAGSLPKKANCLDGVLDSCGQASKGAWGMSWRQEALKGVEDCEKPGVVVKRALIPGSLNRHTLNS